MPKLSEAEIITAIEKGDLRGLSLDTNVFHRPDYNLQAATLRKLAIFYLHKIEVVFPEVIAGEIRTHMTGQLDTTAVNLNKALEEYTKKWRLDFKKRDDANALCGLGAKPDATVAQYWAEFLKQIAGTEFSPNGQVSVSELTDMYFAAAAPFETKTEKKHEFPDAIALLSLEAWAKNKKCLLLAVSADKGWQKYGESSACVAVIDDIHKVYAIINRSAQSVAMAVVNALGQGKAPKLDGQITDAIQSRLDDLDFEIEAESYLSIDSQPDSAVVGKVSYPANPSVLEIEDEQITLAVLVTAAVEVSASFDLSVRDDGEDHHIDSTSETIIRDVEFEVVVTIPKEAQEDPDVLDLELSRGRLSFDFGYLEPFEREMSQREPDEF
jgi:hypothetical protein